MPDTLDNRVVQTDTPSEAILRILRLASLAAVVSALLALATACDHGPVVRVENSSNEVAIVYIDGEAVDLIRPGVTQDHWIPEFTGTHVFEIRALEGGQILASRSFTWEELKKEDGITIVVD